MNIVSQRSAYRWLCYGRGSCGQTIYLPGEEKELKCFKWDFSARVREANLDLFSLVLSYLSLRTPVFGA